MHHLADRNRTAVCYLSHTLGESAAFPTSVKDVLARFVGDPSLSAPFHGVAESDLPFTGSSPPKRCERGASTFPRPANLLPDDSPKLQLRWLLHSSIVTSRPSDGFETS
jgi:hypothetical protein